MKTLYIFGNGLDLAMKMKTSYPNFYEYLKTQKGSPLLELMKQEIDGNKGMWSDMEKAFGLFTGKMKTVEELESLYYELSDYLRKYLRQEEDAFKPSVELKNKFVDDIIAPDKYLSERDKEYYNDFCRINRLSQSYKDSNIMTFNYTNTLETILNWSIVPKEFINQIVHVHGILDDAIIIGVDNENQISNGVFRNSLRAKDILVKSQSNQVMGYRRQVVCENLIKQAHLIILFGVSLGETDGHWWKLIGEQFVKRKDLCIIQHLYDSQVIMPSKKQMIGQIERKQRHVFREKMSAKTQIEWPLESEKRLLFVTNSEAFKYQE